MGTVTTDRVLTGPWVIENHGAPGTFAIMSRVDSQPVRVDIAYQSAPGGGPRGSEHAELAHIGDSFGPIGLANVETITVSADTYPLNIMVVFTTLDLTVTSAPFIAGGDGAPGSYVVPGSDASGIPQPLPVTVTGAQVTGCSGNTGLGDGITVDNQAATNAFAAAVITGGLVENAPLVFSPGFRINTGGWTFTGGNDGVVIPSAGVYNVRCEQNVGGVNSVVGGTVVAELFVNGVLVRSQAWALPAPVSFFTLTLIMFKNALTLAMGDVVSCGLRCSVGMGAFPDFPSARNGIEIEQISA